MQTVRKKPRISPGLFSYSSVVCLHSGYVRGLKPFRTLYYFERHPIAFSKGFETVACDCGEMAKNIITTFLLKKTEPLAVIEPFYRTVCHFCTFS